MVHISEIITLLAANGYRVAEMADIRGTTQRGTLYEVKDSFGVAAVVSVVVQDVPQDFEPHPGVPASLYMAGINDGNRPRGLGDGHTNKGGR